MLHCNLRALWARSCQHGVSAASMCPGSRVGASATHLRPREPDQRNEEDEQHGRRVEDVVRREHERLLVDQPVDLREHLIGEQPEP